MTPRLLEKYRDEIVPAIMERFGYKNKLQVPRIKKVVVNMGIGLGAHDSKLIEEGQANLAMITGQKPKITKAKQAISNFKLRKGSPVGCVVTLRSARMYEFLDRLTSIAMPRIRDFKGISSKGFDGHGNYTFGLNDQTIFPEIDPDKVQRTQGMDININFTRTKKEVAFEVLKMLGMPFQK